MCVTSLWILCFLSHMQGKCATPKYMHVLCVPKIELRRMTDAYDEIVEIDRDLMQNAIVLPSEMRAREHTLIMLANIAMTWLHLSRSC